MALGAARRRLRAADDRAAGRGRHRAGFGASGVARRTSCSATFPGSRFTAALALFLIAMTARSVILYARDIVRARLQADYQASLQLRSAATLASGGWSGAGRLGQGRCSRCSSTTFPGRRLRSC